MKMVVEKVHVVVIAENFGHRGFFKQKFATKNPVTIETEYGDWLSVDKAVRDWVKTQFDPARPILNVSWNYV